MKSTFLKIIFKLYYFWYINNNDLAYRSNFRTTLYAEDSVLILSHKILFFFRRKSEPSRGVAKNGGTLIGQNIGKDQKKRSLQRNELDFSSKVCNDQKKVFAYQSVGFRSQKKNKTNGVTSKW